MVLSRTYFHLSNLIRLLPSFLSNSLRKHPKPTHILFCMVDHFEPGTGNVTYEIEKQRMQTLLKQFPLIADNHADCSGHIPKITWFFPPHYHRYNNLKELVSLCERGYGEIELHLHHGNTKADTPENLESTLEQCIKEYSYFGIFGKEDGKTKYGFIHGHSALNNSKRGMYCGVNSEIKILIRTGCYADFTFPSLDEANPILINSIYYANQKLIKPKSYNKGIHVRRLGKMRDGLMIIQGPLHPFFKEKKLTGLRLYGPHIDGIPPVTNCRIDSWVKTGIHVKGSRNYIIIKVHTHGAESNDIILDKELNDIYSYLGTKYNNRENYFLHHVTARELYNIIKAIEAAEPITNPDEYRDYKINPPKYDSSPRISEASDQLKQLVGRTYK